MSNAELSSAFQILPMHYAAFSDSHDESLPFPAILTTRSSSKFPFCRTQKKKEDLEQNREKEKKKKDTKNTINK